MMKVVGHAVTQQTNDKQQLMPMVTTMVEKVTYTQNWPAYNAAQSKEKARLQVLLHDLCRNLSPPALASAGLAEALRELAANAESLFGIQCTFEQTGGLKLQDISAADHLYRIAQEAISNAVRHGKAKVVRIRLDRRPRSTAITPITPTQTPALNMAPIASHPDVIAPMTTMARTSGT